MRIVGSRTSKSWNTKDVKAKRPFIYPYKMKISNLGKRGRSLDDIDRHESFIWLDRGTMWLTTK